MRASPRGGLPDSKGSALTGLGDFGPDFLRDKKQRRVQRPRHGKQDKQREIGMIHELAANKKKPYRPIERYGFRAGDHQESKFFLVENSVVVKVKQVDRPDAFYDSSMINVQD